MNPAQLLEHFNRISEAPDAVVRLRRFILDLAVRGKLVEQDPNDEPAAELLKRIIAKKVVCNLKEKGKLQKGNLALDLSANESSLPSGWAWVQLAELAAVLNGRAYSKNELLDEGMPVLRVGNLFTSKHWYYSNLKLEDDKYCDVGDLLFSWSASFGPFIWPGPKVIYHYHIWKLSLYSEKDLDKCFLYKFLLHKTQEIKDAGHGVSMLHMTKEKMEKVLVPLPPHAEQHRIVAKVDELMALCDQLEAAQSKRETRRDRLVAASLNRVGTALPESLPVAARFHLDNLPCLTTRLEHIKQLRQTILNLAVRGRLVPQDPNDEPAVTLLKRLGVQIVKSQADANRQPIPAIWEWVTIDQIATVGSGTTPSRDVFEYYSPTGTPWVTSGETNNAFIAQTAQHVSERALKETSLKLYPPGTLIVAMYGQGKTRGQITELSIAATTNQACASIVLKLEDVAHRNYVKLYFQKIYEEIRELAAGGSQPNLNGGKIKSTLIPFPPLAEQFRIVAKVDELMALCDQLEAQLATTKIDSRRLLEAVLRDAIDSSAVAVG